MARSIREAVRSVDPNQPVNWVRTADDALAEAGWARERFVTLLLLGLAVFALMLAVVGLYGVVPVQRIWHPYGARCRSRAHRQRRGAAGGPGHRRGPLRWSRIERGAQQGCRPVVDRQSEGSGRARRRQPGAVGRDDDGRRDS